jgi:tetratricopeptide (TPR) repeat protein
LTADPDYQKAMALMDQGNYDDALQVLKKLADEYPKAAEIYFQIGYILDRGKMWSEAVQAYNQATELSPDSPGIWAELGKTLTRAGKPAEAVVALKRALSIKYATGIASLWDALGCAYGNSGDHRHEVEAFTQAVRLEPFEPSGREYSLLAGAYFNLGQQEDTAGEFAQAIQSYKDSNSVWQTAQKLYPQWPQPGLGIAENYTGMALILQKEGNAHVANGLIQMALNAAPTDIMVLWNSGTFYYKAGNADRYQATLNSLNIENPTMASQLDSSLRSH